MFTESSTRATTRMSSALRTIVFGLIVLALRLNAQIQSFVPLSSNQGPTNFRVCATADVNNSGVPDLICTLLNPVAGVRSIGIFYEVGLVSPATPNLQIIPVAPAPAFYGYLGNQVYPGDFDGDGDIDLLLDFVGAPNPGDSYFGTTVMITQITPGVFSAPQEIGGASIFVGSTVAVGDYNNDGATDFIAGASIYTSNGAAGTFSNAGPLSGYVADFGDFNGDGLEDLLTVPTNPDAGAGASTINIRTGAIGGAVTSISATVNSHIAVGDVDQNGTDDLVVHDRLQNVFRLYAAPSVGQWPVFVASFPTTAGPLYLSSVFNPQHKPLVIADIDSDGRSELVKFVEPSNLVIPPPNSAYVEVQHFIPGTNLPPYRLITFPTGTELRMPQLADYDLDGDLDLITSNVPGGTPVEYVNLDRYGSACAGGPGVPTISVANSYLGSPNLEIGLQNAMPNSLTVLLLSLGQTPTGGCGFQVAITPPYILLPNGQLIVTVTQSNGTATFSNPVPNLPILQGFRFAAQWVTFDPGGSFSIGVTLTSLTEGRTLTLY